MDKNLDQTKGRIKQAAGALTDDPQLAVRGRNEERAGKVKETVEHLKDRLDDAIDDVKERMNKRS